MTPDAGDGLLNDQENVSAQMKSSSPLTYRMRIIKPPVILTKSGINMTPVRLQVRLRRVDQEQTSKEADMVTIWESGQEVASLLSDAPSAESLALPETKTSWIPIRLCLNIRGTVPVQAVQEAAVGKAQKSDQEPESLISDAPSPPSTQQPTTVPVLEENCVVEKAEEVQTSGENVAPAAEFLPPVCKRKQFNRVNVCLPQPNTEQKQENTAWKQKKIEAVFDPDFDPEPESEPEPEPYSETDYDRHYKSVEDNWHMKCLPFEPRTLKAPPNVPLADITTTLVRMPIRLRRVGTVKKQAEDKKVNLDGEGFPELQRNNQPQNKRPLAPVEDNNKKGQFESQEAADGDWGTVIKKRKKRRGQN